MESENTTLENNEKTEITTSAEIIAAETTTGASQSTNSSSTTKTMRAPGKNNQTPTNDTSSKNGASSTNGETATNNGAAENGDSTSSGDSTSAGGSAKNTNPGIPAMNGEMPEMLVCEEGDETCTPPTPPEEGMMNGEFGNFRGGFGGKLGTTTSANSDPMLPLIYMSVGAGGLLISVVVIYACFSKCFKKSPAQTFKNAKIFWLAVGAALILTATIIGIIFAVVRNAGA